MAKQGSLWSDGPLGPGYVESWARRRGHHPVMGVDEAGRGCLAGPVVAAAVVLPDDATIDGLTDSKLMTPAARDTAFDEVCRVATSKGVGVVGPAGIDENGILASTLVAMRTAVEKAVGKGGKWPGIVIVDGTATIPGLDLLQKSWIKGDRMSVSCAAASVLAKVSRDRMMAGFEDKYPGYGFARHKGYGTREHMDAIGRLGPCPIHRMTFAPLKKASG